MKIDENPFRTVSRYRTKPFGPPLFGAGHIGSGVNPGKDAKVFQVQPFFAQYTESEGHPYERFRAINKGGLVDLGGPFLTQKWEPLASTYPDISAWMDAEAFGTHYLHDYVGTVIPAQLSNSGDVTPYKYVSKDTTYDSVRNRWPGLYTTDTDLAVLGTTAINRLRPDYNPTSITQFLVELKRDGVPFLSLLSRKRFQEIHKNFLEHGVAVGSAKTLSNLFLEDQFGLKPFLSDLNAMRDMANNGKTTLDSLVKLNGTNTRRRYSFPDVVSTSSPVTASDSAIVWPIGVDGRLHTLSNWSKTTQVTNRRKQWFTGNWTVQLPTDSEPLSRMQGLLDKLRWEYGIDLTFETVWNLSPWSWLIDWFVNVDDIFTMFDRWTNDAVVLRYGYMMETSITNYQYTWQSIGFNQGGPAVPNSTISDGITTTRKRRIRATPYGFGVAYGGLSGTQKLILAALGITRF